MTDHVKDMIVRVSNRMGLRLTLMGERVIRATLDEIAEAERDTWAYTNDERTEARKGRWVAFLDGGEWSLTHDDFCLERPKCITHESDKPSADDPYALARAREVLRDFLAWHIAQTPPTPAVPATGDYITITRRDGLKETFEVTEVCEGRRSWEVSGTPDILRFIDKEEWWPCLSDIISWEYAERPQPAEPTNLGAVVQAHNGDTWTRIDKGTLPWFHTIKVGNGGATSWGNWLDVTRSGPVTILSDGVK